MWPGNEDARTSFPAILFSAFWSPEGVTNCIHTTWRERAKGLVNATHLGQHCRAQGRRQPFRGANGRCPAPPLRQHTSHLGAVTHNAYMSAGAKTFSVQNYFYSFFFRGERKRREKGRWGGERLARISDVKLSSFIKAEFFSLLWTCFAAALSACLEPTEQPWARPLHKAALVSGNWSQLMNADSNEL